jgi:hypothetical protein
MVCVRLDPELMLTQAPATSAAWASQEKLAEGKVFQS